MELLPVPVEWNFYLTVIEEIFADPIALLAIPAAFIGVGSQLLPRLRYPLGGTVHLPLGHGTHCWPSIDGRQDGLCILGS